jgi:hypothetical protein
MPVVGLSLEQPGFELCRFPVDFMENKVAMGHVSQYCHQCSILLFILKYSNILSTGETGEIWGSSYKENSFGNWGMSEEKSTSAFPS